MTDDPNDIAGTVEARIIKFSTQVELIESLSIGRWAWSESVR